MQYNTKSKIVSREKRLSKQAKDAIWKANRFGKIASYQKNYCNVTFI